MSKPRYETGVSFLLLTEGYCNKKVTDILTVKGIGKDNILIMYDWANGYFTHENQETAECVGAQKLPEGILDVILEDTNVVFWMHMGGATLV